MDIRNTNTTTFKGYDARALQGLYITDFSCLRSLKRICTPLGIDIFTPSIASKSVKKEAQRLQERNHLMWTQDYFTFVRGKINFLLYEQNRPDLNRVIRACSEGLKKHYGYFTDIKIDPHLRGGNFFIVKNGNREELLITENKKAIYPETMLKEMFNVEKIHYLPQLDYHLDLFLRPLNDGKILIGDNGKTKEMFRTGIEKLEKYLSENQLGAEEKEAVEKVLSNIKYELEVFEITEGYDKYKTKENLPRLISTLEEAGFTPIKVPGNYFFYDTVRTEEKIKRHTQNINNNCNFVTEFAKAHNLDMNKVETYLNFQKMRAYNDQFFGAEVVKMYKSNFINAIALEKDGKVIYITNAPLLDKKWGITPEIEAKTGFSTRKYFIEALKDIVDAENIYFIDEKTTEKLFKYTGGVHCTSAEIV